jgi:8-amino-3,8-dideoxy-alpha-D-manno-octulosonate transaminase
MIFINIQKKHYTIIRNELENLNGLTFRSVPKGGEESYAFLNFFLDDLDTARKVNSAFKSNGIDVCFHYYDNNWHYIRNWGSFKESEFINSIKQRIKKMGFLT